MSPLRAYMIKRMEVRNYSPGTIKTYVHAVERLACFYSQSPDQLTDAHVEDYIHYLVKERKLAWKTVHTIVQALKFFFHDILGREKPKFYIPSPKREKRLPVIWSPEEIRKLIETASSPKAKAMIQTAYATGMRSAEVVHLKVTDIDSKHSTIWIRQGKGKKDRAGLLTPSLLRELRKYWRVCRPVDWLFPATKNIDKPMTQDCFGCLFRSIKRKAGFTRPGSVHTLRHSFATHMVAQGADILTVSRLLGHSHISTSMIYCHLAQSIILSKAKNLDLLEVKTLNS